LPKTTSVPVIVGWWYVHSYENIPAVLAVKLNVVVAFIASTLLMLYGAPIVSVWSSGSIRHVDSGPRGSGDAWASTHTKFGMSAKLPRLHGHPL